MDTDCCRDVLESKGFRRIGLLTYDVQASVWWHAEDRLELAVAGLLGRSSRRVALDDEQLAGLGVARRAVGQFAGQARRLEQALAPGEIAGGAGGHPGPGCVGTLVDDLAAFTRMPSISAA